MVGLLAVIGLSAAIAPGTFDDIDSAVRQAMTAHQIPGVSVAIVKDGRLVMARGYGLADKVTGQPMLVGSLSRWNSISQTVTAVAVLQLVEQGKLSLDQHAFDVLGLQPYNGVWGDERTQTITIRQILEHIGGWDLTVSGDPCQPPRRDAIASTMGESPLTPAGTVRYMLAQPLDFAPGTKYAYSTFGYQVLGLIVEKVSGQSYERYVRQNIFGPIGATGMRVADNLLSERVPGEVRYYAPAGLAAEAPYTTYDYPNILAGGGWLGSVTDLARFVAALNGARQPAILQAASFEQMLAAPDRSVWISDTEWYSVWYGLGMTVFQASGQSTWLHPGASPGSRSEMMGLPNGVAFAFLANSDSADSAFLDGLQNDLSRLCQIERDWPAVDLFDAAHPAAVVSAASLAPGAAAPDSLVSVVGTELAGATEVAFVWPLPMSLGSLSARLVDSGGAEFAVPLLYASPGIATLQVPAGAASGQGTLNLKRDSQPEANAALTISAVAPGLFDAFVLTGGRLNLYGTGMRGGQQVTVLLGTTRVPGVLLQIGELDRIAAQLPPALSGSGTLAVSVEVDGVTSNSIRITIE